MLGEWDHDFTIDSEMATLYTLWDAYFLKEMLLTQVPDELRLTLTGNHLFEEFLTTFYERLEVSPWLH